MNLAFQELKRRKDEELEVKTVDINEIPFELTIADISINKQGQIQIYNRAKIKEEMRKLILEELDEER